jgi:predicted DNA-binding transcriptional regulator AlpA
MDKETEKIAISIQETARLSGLSVSYLYRLSAKSGCLKG